MTPSEFKIRFPQFQTVPDARIQFWITDSDPDFNVARWDLYYPMGVANYVAHKLVLSEFETKQGMTSAMANDVTMKQVDTVKVQRDSALVNMAAKDPFMRTLYGQEYLRLRRLVGMGALTV